MQIKRLKGKKLKKVKRRSRGRRHKRKFYGKRLKKYAR
ncbi:hypothetical protein CAMRE0001_1290 [Campylobacter rectus RM3267]|uniref:Uncharacterized protein n=1 Tax=Campylobacter rectus RM3267 TaxID=553218 RepID=B9CZY2_CAMRE|nr:hypothetical protein CAMRE0001_1290 [Campylobacter rectus RM3267]